MNKKNSGSCVVAVSWVTQRRTIRKQSGKTHKKKESNGQQPAEAAETTKTRKEKNKKKNKQKYK